MFRSRNSLGGLSNQESNISLLPPTYKEFHQVLQNTGLVKIAEMTLDSNGCEREKGRLY